MVLNVNQARRETPGCFGLLHLHHSGAALMPEVVADAVRTHLELELFRGGYEAEDMAREKLDKTYLSIARLINSDISEIALSESASVSWNSAFYGIAQTLGKGDRILTSRAEYVSNMIAYRQVAERRGIEVSVVPDDDSGQMSVRALESMIDPRVRLISVTHVPTYNGLVNPVNEIGEIANEYQILYLVDTCQSVGQMPLDVRQMGCDALSATGRKFLRGPRGTGFLYVRKQSLEKIPPPVLDLHSATWVEKDRYELQSGSRRYELFESNIAARIGLGVAAEYAMSLGLTEIYSRIRFLADRLRDLLSDIDGVTVRDKGVEKCGIVTFTIDGTDPERFQMLMREKNINVGVSKRNCALIDFDDWGVEAVVRSPVHYYNTEDEIDFFAKEVRKKAAAPD